MKPEIIAPGHNHISFTHFIITCSRWWRRNLCSCVASQTPSRQWRKDSCFMHFLLASYCRCVTISFIHIKLIQFAFLNDQMKLVEDFRSVQVENGILILFTSGDSDLLESDWWSDLRSRALVLVGGERWREEGE